MSLLNDALRKRHAEQQPPQTVEAAALFKSGRRRFGKSRWIAGTAVAVLLVAGSFFAWRQPPTQNQLPPVAAAAPKALPEALPEATPEATPSLVPVVAPPAPIAPVAILAPTPSGIETQVLPAQAPAPDTTPAPQIPARPQAPAVSQEAPYVQPQPAKRESAAPLGTLPPHQVTSEPLYQKAHLFQRQGRTNEALAMYREVLKIDPSHFETRLNMTSIYLASDQFTQAYGLAADLYRQAPAHPQVVLNLAIAQIGCGRASQALPLLDRAATLPKAPLYTIYFHKAVALRQMGQSEAAITWYQKAEALNAEDPRLLFNLALAFDQLQTYAQAVDYYSKYLKAAGEQIDAATRRQVQARIRTLRAELAATQSGVDTP